MLHRLHWLHWHGWLRLLLQPLAACLKSTWTRVLIDILVYKLQN